MGLIQRVKGLANNAVNKVKEKVKNTQTQKEKAETYDRISVIVKDFGQSKTTAVKSKNTVKPKNKR